MAPAALAGQLTGGAAASSDAAGSDSVAAAKLGALTTAPAAALLPLDKPATRTPTRQHSLQQACE